MAFIDYVLDQKDKSIKGKFLSVLTFLAGVLWNFLGWLPCMPDSIVNRMATYSVEANAFFLGLIGAFWYKQYKQDQMDKYVNFAQRQLDVTNGNHKPQVSNKQGGTD